MTFNIEYQNSMDMGIYRELKRNSPKKQAACHEELERSLAE